MLSIPLIVLYLSRPTNDLGLLYDDNVLALLKSDGNVDYDDYSDYSDSYSNAK